MADDPTEPPDPNQPPPPPPNIGNVGALQPPQLMAHIIAQQMAQGGFPPGGIQLTLPGIVQQQAHWQGPYPPPDAVERYEVVLPGALNRLISMAESLQAAQIVQSEKAVENTRKDTQRGHWLGFATTIGAMIGAVVCLKENAWVAGAFLSVPVMAVARALIETSKAPTQTDIIKAASQLQPAAPPTQTRG